MGEVAQRAVIINQAAVSVKQAAEILGVSSETIRRMIDQRQLPSLRARRKILVPVVALEKLLEAPLCLVISKGGGAG